MEFPFNKWSRAILFLSLQHQRPGVETGKATGAQRPLLRNRRFFCARVLCNGGLCGQPLRLAGSQYPVFHPAQSAALARVETGSDGSLFNTGVRLMKSQIPSINPVEAALAQAAINNAISLTPDFQTEMDYRLRMVSSAVDHLAFHFDHADSIFDTLESEALWGVAKLISNEIKTLRDLNDALHHCLNEDARGEVK